MKTYAPRLLASADGVRTAAGRTTAEQQLGVVVRAAHELRRVAEADRQRRVEADGAALEQRFAHLTALEDLRVLDTSPDRSGDGR